MIDYDQDVWELVRQCPEILHVRPLDRHARHQVELLQKGEAPVVVRLDQVVAVRKVPYAPHVGGLAVTLQDPFYTGVAQVGVRDDPVGEPRAVGCCL